MRRHLLRRMAFSGKGHGRYPNRRAHGQSPGNIGPTSARHVPFSLDVSFQHAPQPVRLTVPLDTPGTLLEGLRCLTASRPFPTRSKFEGKTRSRFLLTSRGIK